MLSVLSAGCFRERHQGSVPFAPPVASPQVLRVSRRAPLGGSQGKASPRLGTEIARGERGRNAPHVEIGKIYPRGHPWTAGTGTPGARAACRFRRAIAHAGDHRGHWKSRGLPRSDRQDGTVEKNRIADLVILNSNPLENINTRDIFAVLKGGKLIDRTYHHYFTNPLPRPWMAVECETRRLDLTLFPLPYLAAPQK